MTDQALLDSMMALTDANGNELARDDDSGDGNNSQFTLKPAPDIYRLTVWGYNSSHYGGVNVYARYD